MYKENRVAVVMPIHNEADHLTQAIARVPEYVDLIVAVDDGSVDSTWDRLNEITDSRLIRFRHGRNRGVGAATKAGYHYCLRQEVDFIGVMDGDGQMDGRDLAGLLDRLIHGADYVKGNRFLHSETIGRMPATRYVGNRVLSWLSSRAERYNAPLDAQCGYAVIRRRALESIDLEGLYDRYGFPNEMFFAARHAGLSVVSAPVRTIYATERSGINPLTAVPRILWLIGRHYLRRNLASASRRLARSGSPAIEPGIATGPRV